MTMSNETQLVPKNSAEREAWVAKLNEAGIPYRMEKTLGMYSLYVDADAAERVLGVEKPKPWKLWKKMAAWAAGIMLLLALCTPKGTTTTEPEPKQLSPAEQAAADSLAAIAARKEKIQAQFDPWDGSHVGLTMALKKQLNDADSYEHVNTDVHDMGEKLVIKCTFRAANGFGAKMLNSYYAEVDLDGNVLKWEME